MWRRKLRSHCPRSKADTACTDAVLPTLRSFDLMRTQHWPLIWSFYMTCIKIKFFFVALTIGLFASGLLA